MSKPHPHAEILRAIADDANIELEMEYQNKWLLANHYQVFGDPECKFRIKPKGKKPVVRWKWAFIPVGEITWYESSRFFDSSKALLENFKRISEGQIPTQVVCLEYTRTEFPE
jgi:hypothetical protein